MTTVIITSNLENEIRDIRTLEAKIQELDEMKKEKEALIKSVLDEAGVEEPASACKRHRSFHSTFY